MTHPARLLLLVVGEEHMHGEVPLFEYLVRRLRQLEVAGATAIRSELGFGRHEALLRSEPLEFRADRSIVVFAVDAADRIERVVPEIREAIAGGLVVVMDVDQIGRD